MQNYTSLAELPKHNIRTYQIPNNLQNKVSF